MTTQDVFAIMVEGIEKKATQKNMTAAQKSDYVRHELCWSMEIMLQEKNRTNFPCTREEFTQVIELLRAAY